jgi:hypothetical protein
MTTANSSQEFKAEWSEALRRLLLLMSGKWCVDFMGQPHSHGTDYDYNVRLVNVLTVERVSASGPTLAAAITKAISKAADTDPSFREVEAKIAAMDQTA